MAGWPARGRQAARPHANLPEIPRDPEGGLRVSIGIAEHLVGYPTGRDGWGVLAQRHFAPAASVSAIATMGATVTAKRQLRATTSLIIRAAPDCEVWA